MNLVRRLFPFRTCTIEIKDGERALQRPCLLYHIKRCQGPCIQAVSKPDYRAQIDQIELFLEGRQETVVKALTGEMRAASERTDYEQAAGLRDKIRAIERTMESQKMAAFRRTELDLVGLARQDNQAAIQLFAIRNGSLLGPRRVPPGRRPRGARRGGARELPRAVLRARDVDPAAGPRPVRAARDARPGGVPGGPAWRARAPAGPAARREARAAWRSPRRTPARRWPASRRAGWPTRARPSWRSRSWPRRSGCRGRRCGSSATTSRTSRAPIRSAAWSSSRRASRGPGSTAGSGSRRSSGRTTSPRTRRCCGGASDGRGPVRRARPRSCAGRCRTS